MMACLPSPTESERSSSLPRLLLTFGYNHIWIPVTGYWFLVTGGYWLMVFGYRWLLVFAYWLLVVT